MRFAFAILVTLTAVACAEPRIELHELASEGAARSATSARFEVSSSNTDGATGEARISIRAVGEKPEIESMRVAPVGNPARTLAHTKNGKQLTDVPVPVPGGAAGTVEIDLTLSGRTKDDESFEEVIHVRLRSRSVESGRMRESTAGVNWKKITYPLWGLPRDVLDLPFTALTRGGLSLEAFGDSMKHSNRFAVADVVVYGSLVAGFVVGLDKGWHHGDSNLLVRSAYADYFALVDGLVGGAVGLGVVAVYEFGVVPVQTVLLRSGVDHQYFKHDPMVLVLGPTGSLSALEENDRSICYFPNWKYLAAETTHERDPETMIAWYVDSIEIEGPAVTPVADPGATDRRRDP